MGKDNFGMLFGVFDGHGGDDVSKFAKVNFKNESVSNSKSWKALSTFSRLTLRKTISRLNSAPNSLSSKSC